MKYFILATAVDVNDSCNIDYYLKGKSFDVVADQISRYANGYLVTDHFILQTRIVSIGYLREIHIENYPELTTDMFAKISERRSYNLSFQSPL